LKSFPSSWDLDRHRRLRFEFVPKKFKHKQVYQEKICPETADAMYFLKK